MRIGINCLLISPDYFGGINNFLFGLLDGIKDGTNSNKYVIFATDHNARIFKRFECDNIEIIITDLDQLVSRQKKKRLFLEKIIKIGSVPLYKFFDKIFYQKLSNFISSKIDILYTADTIFFPMNYKGIKTVLSMHDIQQVHYPEFFTPEENQKRKITFNACVEQISYMQASSEYIKNDFIKYFKSLTSQNVKVINEGVDINLFDKTPIDNSLEDYNLPEKYLFYPAQLWKHKDHLTILKALVEFKKNNGYEIPLILTGGKYSASQEIFDFIDESGLTAVNYLGKVPFNHIIQLYKQATFLITAVLYESSSMPILEAAAAKTPIIASNTPPNLELGENLKINYFESQNSISLEKKLSEIWGNDELIKSQISFNANGINFYSWINSASKFESLFSSIKLN